MIWVKRILIFITAFTLGIFLVVLFISKERLCNLAINTLSENAGITMCYMDRETSTTGCSIKNITLLYGHSPVAKVKSAEFHPWIAEVSGIRIEGIAADMLPPSIESIRFEPLSGKVYSRGDFGVINGRVSWSSRTLTLELLPSSLMKRKFGRTLRMFKTKGGKYIYALSF